MSIEKALHLDIYGCSYLSSKLNIYLSQSFYKSVIGYFLGVSKW